MGLLTRVTFIDFVPIRLYFYYLFNLLTAKTKGIQNYLITFDTQFKTTLFYLLFNVFAGSVPFLLSNTLVPMYSAVH